MNDPTALNFLTGAGICGEVARNTDWSKTPVGPPETWPQCLRTILGVIFHSRHPMFLWWGDDLIQFYNDAYLPSFGKGKHPAAMGQRGRDCWGEIWPIISPQIDDVMQRARPSWNEDHLVPIFRNGRIEEVYWTYGYSPVFLESGKVGGTLVVCTETTGRVLAQRRLEVVRSLALALARIDDSSRVPAVAAGELARAAQDLPFALHCSGEARLECIGVDGPLAAELARALEGRLQREGVVALPSPVTAGPWPEPVSEVFVVPLDAARGEAFVFGISSRLPFDALYRGFLQQVVEQVVSARARARIEVERRNLLEKAPVATALLTGPDHFFEIANPLYEEMVGRKVLGKTYVGAFPELKGSAIIDILDRVYARGEPFVTSELKIGLDRRRDGNLEDAFFKFNLEPLRDATGKVYGMMAIAVEITEQVRARQALEHAYREREQLLLDLEAASRAKDEFLAMLGHELRNPLAPILTALELLKFKGRAAAWHAEHELIERQTRHLVHLVDDLLDVSRVAQGKIELRKVRVPLADVVARALETASPLLEQKGHAVTVEVPAAGLDVDADVMRLTQVVANLLSNAARYTEAGGHVAVKAAREGQEVVLRVTDDGAGIDSAQLPRLFDAFFQVKRTTERGQGGLGLGLALVKSLVTLHGGAVRAMSEGVGRGSTFEVRLPVATLPATVGRAAPRHLPLRPASSIRVLMVDDNTDISAAFEELLEALGFEVRVAHDAPGALEVASRFHPEVAVLDIGLPVIDGYELAARLRHQLGTKAPRLIAMTGYGQKHDRDASARAGFERHLTKPVDAEALVAAILGRREAGAENGA